MNRRFPVSFLNILVFCEIQLYLREVMRVKMQYSRRVLEGIQAHEKMRERFIPEKTLTLHEAFEEAERNGVSMRSREVFSAGRHLYGYIDELIIMPESMVVIEDKTSERVGEGTILQTHGYCAILSEKFPDHTVYWAVRKIPEMKILEMNVFKSEDRDAVTAGVKRIESILTGKPPVFHGNRKKCMMCNFKKICYDVFPERN